MNKCIVSVQDISCFGQCSLTVAMPILSAMGVETAILPSAILSTHTAGFKNFTVHDLTDEMPSIVNHWKSENISFDAIYTGYIGDARQFDTIIEMKQLLKDGGLLIVDPAMADNGKLYIALNEDIVAGMRSLCSEADVVLPNLTEAAFLLDREYKENCSREEIEEMLRALGAMGPSYSIITGVSFEDGKIGAACYDKANDEFIYYFTDLMSKRYHGTGDIFSSVAVADIVNGCSIPEALKDACEFTAAAIRETISDPEHGYGVHFEKLLCAPELWK